MKWTPHAYQREAIKFVLERACAGLLLDPGLGKTAITYAVFKILRAKSQVRRMLVIAPLRPAYSVWPGEAARWDDFHGIKVGVLHGPNKEAVLHDPTIDVHVINPEGLGWLFAHKLDWWWDILTVDESTRFKHANTQRFKLLKPTLPRFRRRIILTGSPAPNGLLDLFGQIYILDLGNALGRFITYYRTVYFDSCGYGGYTWVIRPGAADRIQEKIKPLVLRMDALDLLDLPPLINNTVEVTLPDEAMKTYRRMEDLMIAQLEEELVVTAANAAAATNKCRQIANGGIYHEGGEEWTKLHDAKTEAVQEIVEELSGQPCLVAYEYKHDLDRLLGAFPDAPHIGGGVPARRFREIEQLWNLGQIPVLLAQPQSVAHGLNLQGTRAAVIWHSLTWNLEDAEQFVRRVWRQGQKERVIVHHIVAKDTVDEIVMKALASKDKVQRTLLSALKSFVKGRRR